MNSPAIRAWWKLVRILAAVYLASLCAGVATYAVPDAAKVRDAIRVAVGLQPIGANPAWQRAEQLSGELRKHADPKGTARTTLRVELMRDEFTVQCRVALPRPFFEQLQRTVAPVGDREVVVDVLEDFCGRADVNWRSGALDTYRFYVAPGLTEGIVEATFEPARYGEARIATEPGDRAFDLRVDFPHSLFGRHDFTLQLATSGARALVRNARPFSQNDAETVLRTTLVGPRPSLVVRVIPLHDGEPSRPRRPHVSEIVGRFRNEYTPIADPLADALLAALPFLLVLAIRREKELTDVPGSERLFGFAYAAALLFIGMSIVRAAADLVQWTGEALRPADPATAPCSWVIRTDGASALLVAYVVLLWPLLVSRCRNCVRLPLTSVGRSSALLAAATVLAAVAAGLAVGPCSAGFGVPDLDETLIVAGVAAFLALLAAVSEVVDGLWRQLLYTVLTLAAAAAYFAADLLTRDVTGWYPVVAPFVAPMFYTMGRLAFPRLARTTLIPASIVVAALLAYGRPDYDPWKPWLISAIGFDLTRTAMLVVAAALIWLLYHLSRTGKWHELEDGERAVAIVLVLTMFFVRWNDLLYAAMAVAAGWAVMRYWIFVPRRIPDDADPNVHATIRDLIRLNEMETALRALKREMRSKLSKAEIRFHDYAMKVDAMEAHVDEQRQRLKAHPDLPPAAVLSSGTPVPPWKRGLESARYGLLFGIPWIVLFLRQFHSYVAPHYGSDWVATLAAVIHAVAGWPLLGFVFGYFYPHLRGDSGISKGLYLFIAVTLPLFAATAIGSPGSTEAWKSLAYFALQLFIHCLLLGLIAGDYETLRASGLRWRHVIDVHNLGGVTAWASSMVFAIATAATTFTPAAAGNFANFFVAELTRNIGPGEDASRRNEPPPQKPADKQADK